MAEEEERSRPGGGYDPGAGYEEGAEEVGEVAEGATGSDAPDDAVHEGYEDGRGESVVPCCGPASSGQAHATLKPCVCPQESLMATLCLTKYLLEICSACVPSVTNSHTFC